MLSKVWSSFLANMKQYGIIYEHIFLSQDITSGNLSQHFVSAAKSCSVSQLMA